MNQKKNDAKIDIIRTKSSVRIGLSETTSVAAGKMADFLEVTRKGRDVFIYDKRSGRLTEIPSDNIAYIQYESDIQSASIETGEGSSSGS